MLSEEQIVALRQQVANAIADELIRANVDWAAFDQLSEPRVCIEAEFQDRLVDSPSAERRPPAGFTISRVVDLTGVVSPRPSVAPDRTEPQDPGTQQDDEPPSGIIVPLSHGLDPVVSHDKGGQAAGAEGKSSAVTNDSETSDRDDPGHGSRTAISGLRPSRQVPVIEDNTQRQMRIMDENFPKRRKAEAVGYAMKPSTLDKLIIGIWEQLHRGMSILDPAESMGQFATPPLLRDAVGAAPDGAGQGVSTSGPSSAASSGRQFSDTTVFCRRITQGSRTCRSIEVIVQARWVEHFDAYVEHLKADDPRTSGTRHRKAALAEACGSFGWSEKELRNKMAIWRGYQEIKDAGGWAALVFAGMGVYRFCKYRVGFDHDSMQRLHSVRPALEVAADTLNPSWRRLLSTVGGPSERVYTGHPHDWVVCPDGSPPVPLRKTYLQWDPGFEYEHIEESVVDRAAWGSEDPRWLPPSSGALTRISGLFLCPTCANEQSDDPKANCCCCFPSLFGCAAPTPPPIQVFRTPDGRNNGLMALCAFERGAAVGEFVGVVTKGLQDVDVMENATGSTRYQIWQGSRGNFTRFVNHSCNANAQYQQFTWLNTQRIILVSKGIEAGSEITVDYSDKYWKGLDKKCLCGERKCRYRRGR
ncbi:hypothetical protein F4802DRAFT_268640 [Xylaria palmicola]|nr:hypothetical protein F4802DRAFT_268640 [Xylaria palmicola]